MADRLLDVDIGGAGAVAPAMPTVVAECSASRTDGRGLRTHVFVIKHISDSDLVAILSGSHFRQGQDDLQFLNPAYDTQVRPSDLSS